MTLFLRTETYLQNALDVESRVETKLERHTVRLPKPTRRLKLGCPNSFTIIFNYAASTLEVNRDENCMRIRIQRILDQFYNHSIEMSD